MGQNSNNDYNRIDTLYVHDYILYNIIPYFAAIILFMCSHHCLTYQPFVSSLDFFTYIKKQYPFYG